MSTSQEFTDFVVQLRASPLPPGLADMRAAYDAMGAQFRPAEGVRRRSATLGGRPALWAEPEQGGVDGAVLYLHGGGYAIGSIASHQHMADGIALRTGLATVVLDYRLAPEHPFPAALDDAFAAYRDLLGIFAPGMIVVSGDSAGGGLAVALLARIIDADLPRPACAYLISPWVDMVGDSLAIGKADADPFVTQALLKEMTARYLPGATSDQPFASPIDAHLDSAPPTLIQVGSAELLMRDSLRLAQALGEANVDVELRIAAHMIHVWPWLFPIIPEGAEALDQGCDFIRRRVGAGA